jgi:sulfite reductase beta subunit-like hemoprotein
MADDFPHVRRPCDECPWRRDAKPGRFPAGRYEALRETVEQRLGSPIFACHKTPDGKERACAGWLATVGHRSIPVRLAVSAGRLDPAALEPGPGWPPLFTSYEELAESNGAGRG